MTGQPRHSLAGVGFLASQGLEPFQPVPGRAGASSVPLCRGGLCSCMEPAQQSGQFSPLPLPLPQSSAPEVQGLFAGLAGGIHSGSTGAVCGPQKSTGARVKGLSQPCPRGHWPLAPLQLILTETAPAIARMPSQRWALSRATPTCSAAQAPFFSEDKCKASTWGP